MGEKRAVLSTLLAVCVVGIAQADLSVFSSHAVLDDRDTPSDLSDDLFFFRDLSRFTNMTYAEQLASIAALNTELSGAGPWQDNWHLADSTEMQAVLTGHWTDVPSAFGPSYGIDDFIGRYDYVYPPSGHHAYEVLVSSGTPPMTHDSYGVSDGSSSDSLGAWAVTCRVPVPGAGLLGMIGLGYAGMRLRRKT